MTESSVSLPEGLVIDLFPEVNEFVMTMQREDINFYSLHHLLDGAVWACGLERRMAGVADETINEYLVQDDLMTGGQGSSHARLHYARDAIYALCQAVGKRLKAAGIVIDPTTLTAQNGYAEAPYRLVSFDDYYRALLKRTN